MGGVPNARGPHPHLDHLGPLTNGATSPGCHCGVPLMPMVFWTLLVERCATNTHQPGVTHTIPSSMNGITTIWWTIQFFLFHYLVIFNFLRGGLGLRPTLCTNSFLFSYFCLHIIPYYIHILGNTPYLVGASLSSEPSKASYRSFEGWMTFQILRTSTIWRVVSPYRVKFPIRVPCQQGFIIWFVCF